MLAVEDDTTVALVLLPIIVEAPGPETVMFGVTSDVEEAGDNGAEPELPEWPTSPPYVAVIVMFPDKVEGGVYVRAHWLFERVHALGLKVPPAPLSLHDTTPIIAEEGFVVSEMEAVTVFALPEVSVSGFAVTVVTVASSELRVVIDALPLLVP